MTRELEVDEDAAEEAEAQVRYYTERAGSSAGRCKLSHQQMLVRVAFGVGRNGEVSPPTSAR